MAVTDSLSAVEFQVLDTCAELQVKVGFFAKDLAESFGFGFDEVTSVLARLIARGWLEIEGGSAGPGRPDCKSDFVGLTAVGGAVWSRYRRPKWGAFVDIGECYEGNDLRLVFHAPSEHIVVRWVKLVSSVEDWDASAAVNVVRVSPWRALYWRPDEIGFRGEMVVPYRIGVEHNRRACILEYARNHYRS